MGYTHKRMWKERPKEKSVFVSNFLHHTFPILKKKPIKKILDVACGNGLGVALPLVQEGYEVHAFDKWTSAINATKKIKF